MKFIIEIDEKHIIKQLKSEGETDITNEDMIDFIRSSIGCQLMDSFKSEIIDLNVDIVLTTEEYYKNFIKLSEKYSVYK